MTRRGEPATPKQRAALERGQRIKRERAAQAKKEGRMPAGDRWAMLLDGRLTVKDLDDDEIAKMRVRGRDGTFSGRRPAIPSHLAQEWQAEGIRRATDMFRTAAPLAVKRLLEIASDPDTKDSDAVRALQIVLDRGLGKVPETIRVQGQSPFDALLDGAVDLDREMADLSDDDG